MKTRCVVGAAFFAAAVLSLSSCNLSPKLALRVINPSYTFIDAGTNVQITFQLYNSGSEYLQDCKVRWYVDDLDSDGSDAVIEYDEITSWAPTFGYDLGVGQTSPAISVETDSGIFLAGINFYGIYEMGWDYSPNE